MQVTNVREGSQWLSYTYLHTRMRQNPLPYGISWEEVASDPRLEGHRYAAWRTGHFKWASPISPGSSGMSLFRSFPCRTCPAPLPSRRKLITEAARELERSKMARFDERSGNLYVTELGRVASHFYIRHSSIVTFNELLKPHMNEADVLAMISKSSGAERGRGSDQITHNDHS